MLKPHWKNDNPDRRFLGSFHTQDRIYDIYYNDKTECVVVKWDSSTNFFAYLKDDDLTTLIDPVLKQVCIFGRSVQDSVIQYGKTM